MCSFVAGTVTVLLVIPSEPNKGTHTSPKTRNRTALSARTKAIQGDGHPWGAPQWQAPAHDGRRLLLRLGRLVLLEQILLGIKGKHPGTSGACGNAGDRDGKPWGAAVLANKKSYFV